MIWQNPWAWLGIVTLALPVLIHLLGRGHARVLPFPSLRFLDASRLLPTRRTRLHDLPLLIVRLGILLAAVTALAQPLLVTRQRTRAASQMLARAIIVDTSASMRRPALAGRTSFDAAHAEALRFAADARASIILETSSPAAALGGAIEWLARQEGRREIVIVSDFQSGVLDERDVAAISHDIGIRLERIDVAVANAPIETRSRAADGETVARFTLAPERTEAEWTKQAGTAGVGLALIAGADLPRAQAAARAAATLGARLPLDASHGVAIVFPSSARRGDARSALAPWMTTLAARLRSDSVLQSAASLMRSERRGDSTGLVVARNAAARPLIVAASSRDTLFLFSSADAGSVVSAALIAAVERARSIAPPLGELDPATIPSATLATWQREPSVGARRDADTAGQSDGRWLWMAALALLGLETWMRRTKREPAAVAERAHERAA